MRQGKVRGASFSSQQKAPAVASVSLLRVHLTAGEGGVQDLMLIVIIIIIAISGTQKSSTGQDLEL
jgi:hypothetical protein